MIYRISPMITDKIEIIIINNTKLILLASFESITFMMQLTVKKIIYLTFDSSICMHKII